MLKKLISKEVWKYRTLLALPQLSSNTESLILKIVVILTPIYKALLELEQDKKQG